MLSINTDSELLWSVNTIFQYPEKEDWDAYCEDALRLLNWARQAGIYEAEALRGQLAADEINLSDLQIDYTGLFINAFNGVKVRSFAGWYLGDETLFGSVEQEVRKLYQRHGVLMDEESNMPADSISIELEFLALMAEEYARGNDQAYAALRDIARHLQNWVFSFLKEMEQKAETDFYQLTAVIIGVFLADFIKRMGVA